MESTVLTRRYTLIDLLRGAAVLAMIAYHVIWDLVEIYGVEIGNFGDRPQWRIVIQRTIRWSFIFLSGFCFQMGRKKLKRGLIVFGSSILVTLVTMAITPASVIHIGVLTLLGSAMLLTLPLDKIFSKISGWIGVPVCLLLFLATEFVEQGYIGREPWKLELPWQLYDNYFTAWLGFPHPIDFWSSDYVPLIPWLFAFWIGYFTYSIFKKQNWLPVLRCIHFAPLEWIGRNALVIYLAHQAVIYGVLYLIFI